MKRFLIGLVMVLSCYSAVASEQYLINENDVQRFLKTMAAFKAYGENIKSSETEDQWEYDEYDAEEYAEKYNEEQFRDDLFNLMSVKGIEQRFLDGVDEDDNHIALEIAQDHGYSDLETLALHCGIIMAAGNQLSYKKQIEQDPTSALIMGMFIGPLLDQNFPEKTLAAVSSHLEELEQLTSDDPRDSDTGPR
ncbi:MAG: hypothetical protein ACQEQ8_06825 [Pseudomonadota bacterium]